LRVSLFTTVTIIVKDEKLRLSGLPDKFIGCFTGTPSKGKLIEAIHVKAEMQQLPESMLKNVLKVASELPDIGEFRPKMITPSGTVSVYGTEPLFKA